MGHSLVILSACLLHNPLPSSVFHILIECKYFQFAGQVSWVGEEEELTVWRMACCVGLWGSVSMRLNRNC